MALLEPGRLPTFAGALVVLLLAGWLLWLGPSRKLHRALALFFILRGLIHIIIAIDSRVDSPLGRATVWFVLAVPFAAANAAFVFRQEHGPPRPWLKGTAGRLIRWTILVSALLVELVYLYDHGLWITRGSSGYRTGWLSLFIPGFTLTSIALAFIVQRAARYAASERDQRALHLFALALSLEPAYRLTFDVLGQTVLFDSPIAIAGFLLRILGLALVAAVFVTMFLRRTLRRPVLALPLIAIGSGIIMATISTITQGPTLALATAIWTLDAFWLSAFAAFTVYSTLLYHLFDLDLKAKALVNGGTFAAGIGFILVVVGESIERIIPISDGVLAILLAVVITLFLRPAHKLAKSVAESLFPDVAKDEEYLVRRRVQVYRAALEGAYRDGDITHKERDVLATLRNEIGLEESAATLLEDRIRESLRQGAFQGPPCPLEGRDASGLPKPP